MKYLLVKPSLFPASCMNFVVDDLDQTILDLCICTSGYFTCCCGRRRWNLAPFLITVLSLPPILTMSRCWQAGNLPGNLTGMIKEQGIPIKLDKHKYLNLEQASLDQLFTCLRCALRLFLASSLPPFPTNGHSRNLVTWKRVISASPILSRFPICIFTFFPGSNFDLTMALS